jgi:hypothetical protein
MIAVHVRDCPIVNVEYQPDDTVERFLQRVVAVVNVDLVYGYFTKNGSTVSAIRDIHLKLYVRDLSIASLAYHSGIGGVPRACLWVNYIDTLSIAHGQRDIIWRPTIRVSFKPFRSFTPEYSVDCKTLPLITTNPSDYQNRWPDYWPDNIDKRYKFISINGRTSIMVVSMIRGNVTLGKYRYIARL